MATQTNFLKSTLPLNNEYQDTWDSPNNANFEAIDTWAKAVNDEIEAARFNKASLEEFLAVGHDDDGNLKPTSEVIAARNSFLYGDETDEATPVDFNLSSRLLQGDKEVHRAREGLPSLRDSLALKSYLQSAILGGTKDSNGFPTWLGRTGANAQIDGSATELKILIDGKLCRIRTLESISLSGQSAGTYQLYAQYEEDGVIVVDGDATSSPPAVAQGQISNDDDDKQTIFSDATVDFTAENVKVGDILDIINDPQGNTGSYQIKEIAPGGEVNQIKILGIFPGNAAASINYVIRNPWMVTLGFDATKTPEEGKLYLGEADFDGASVVAVRALHFKDVYVGDWRAIDISTVPTFEQIWDHNLFSEALEVKIQVCSANDGSQPIEEVSVGTISNTQGVNLTNGISHSPDVFNPGTTDASFVQGAFSSTLSAALTGDVTPDSAIKMKYSTTRVWVKNAVSGVFYKDYSGAAKTSGYIRVIVTKRV